MSEYATFISYTDHDRKIAVWLQKSLESYHLPKSLAQPNKSSRLGAAFLDRGELCATPDLNETLLHALKQSKSLVVVCTPRSAVSKWVGWEIDAFRMGHGGKRVFAALFEGDENTAFHPQLTAHSNGTSAIPLAADFRRKGDGPKLALLKLVAAILELPLDRLIQRDAQRRRKRAMIATFAATLGGAALVATGFTAWDARRLAEASEARNVRAMDYQLNELRNRIRAGGTLDMAAAVIRGAELFDDGKPAAELSESEALNRATARQSEADVAVERGEVDIAARRAREAWDLTAELLRQHPHDASVIFSHGQSAYWVGLAAWRRRDTPLAANAFARYADQADALIQLDPVNRDWLLEQGNANSNLGTLAAREARDPARAKLYFEKAQTAFAKVAAKDPNDRDALDALADGEAWLADVAAAQNDIAGALERRARQSRLVNQLIELDPRNLSYRAARISVLLGTARLLVHAGSRDDGRRFLAKAREAAVALIHEDPANASSRDRLRAIDLFAAQTELDGSSTDRAAIRRANGLIGNCASDLARSASPELVGFCGILAARAALLAGDRDRAQHLVDEPGIKRSLAERSLTPRWHLDLYRQCRALGPAVKCP